MPHRPGILIEIPYVPSEEVHVLSADDFKPWRKEVLSLLRNNGFLHVFEACDGLEAARLASELSADIAILDIGMPGLNGIEVARRLQRSIPKCKVIMLTQNSDEDIRGAAFEAGAVAFVLKAQMTSDLIPAVRAALRTRR